MMNFYDKLSFALQYLLTHFQPLFHFYTPWKHQKNIGWKWVNFVSTPLQSASYLPIYLSKNFNRENSWCNTERNECIQDKQLFCRNWCNIRWRFSSLMYRYKQLRWCIMSLQLQCDIISCQMGISLKYFLKY